METPALVPVFRDTNDFAIPYYSFRTPGGEEIEISEELTVSDS
jgi:hypothetical protein